MRSYIFRRVMPVRMGMGMSIIVSMGMVVMMRMPVGMFVRMNMRMRMVMIMVISWSLWCWLRCTRWRVAFQRQPLLKSYEPNKRQTYNTKRDSSKNLHSKIKNSITISEYLNQIYIYIYIFIFIVNLIEV